MSVKHYRFENGRITKDYFKGPAPEGWHRTKQAVIDALQPPKVEPPKQRGRIPKVQTETPVE